MNDTDSSMFFSAMAVLADAHLPPFVLALAIGVPSALLYCLELWTILTNFTHFRSSFFVLVIVRAICSLVNYVVAFFAHRFGKIGLFLPLYLCMPRVVLASIQFVIYYAFHVENLLTAFMLLNRSSAILLPMRYEKVWRRGLPISLLIIFVVPLPFTAPIFNLDSFIHVQADNVTFTIDDHKTENELNSCEIAAWSAILFAAICLLLNLASLFAYKLCQSKNAGQPNDANAKYERKMTIYTVYTFLSQLIMAIFMVLIYVTASQFVDEQNNRYALAQKWLNISLEKDDLLFLATFNQNPWVNDVTTMAIPAWLLLWASTKMREIIATKFNWLWSSFEKNNKQQQQTWKPVNVQKNAISIKVKPFSYTQK